MSIEDKIDKLTAAIENLTEAFIAHTNDAAPAKAAKAPAKGKAAADEGEEQIPEHIAKAAKELEAKQAKAALKPAAKAPPKAPAAEDGIDPAYAPVKAAILDAIAKGHRDDIQKLFKKYRVKNGQELPVETYDEVLGEIDGIVNGEGDLA